MEHMLADVRRRKTNVNAQKLVRQNLPYKVTGGWGNYPQFGKCKWDKSQE